MENIYGGGSANFIVSSAVESLLLYYILRCKAASGIWYAYVYVFIRQTSNIKRSSMYIDAKYSILLQNSEKDWEIKDRLFQKFLPHKPCLPCT